ncbi:MAG: peptidoglycan DD-metalloendopeptidase family protein [Desulfovermiculus sp.]|nr:peptidoglycan DD-metalloendopeptidase family protein [Desulfovermiculus sp.]
MPLHTYFFGQKRIRLKRPRRMRIVFPLLLCLVVLVLAVVSVGKHFVSPPDQKKIQANKERPTLSTDSGQIDKQTEAGEGTDFTEGGKTLDQAQKRPEGREPLRIVEKKVQPGQTITSMLSDFLRPADVYALNREAKDIFPLRKIRAGQPYRLKLQDGRLQGFEYEIDDQKKLCVDLAEGQFSIATQSIEYDVRTAVVDGAVRSSLFKAVTDQGESPVLAIKLADIFAWDIDFIRDIREEDAFRLVVEKRYRKEEFSGYGPIVAAQFVNQGHTYQAFLFSTQDGRTEYFNAQGQAVRKTFLKAPLNFTRISSGYTHRRKHPILNVVRPHLGIDYAAPRGTPVKSVADGVVIARAYQRGGGNYIKIRHPNNYITIYMHLSKFGSGIRKGVKVRQGQTIAYVGSTGLSTGPHLDYRVKKNGSYINPLKIDSQPASPVPDKEMPRFQRAISPLQAVLEGENPLYAQSDNQPSAPSSSSQF